MEIVEKGRNLEKAKSAAPAIGVKPSTLYRAAERGEVPCYRLGRAVRFDVEELRRWMRDQAKQSVDAVVT